MQTKINIQKMVDEAARMGLTPSDHRMRRAMNLVLDNLRDDHPDYVQAPQSRSITQTGWGNVRRGRYGRLFLPWLAAVLFILRMDTDDLARYLEIKPYTVGDFKPETNVEKLYAEVYSILTE